MESSSVKFEPAASLPDRLTLETRDLHLWFLPLDRPAERVARLEALLSPLEVERANRFHLPVLRHRHAVAHGVLRELLGAYLGAPFKMEFSIGPKGKPALEKGDRPDPFHFNLAHSGDYALYGFARSELGVDIELMREDRDLLGLARRFFAPLEHATIQALPDAGRRAAFYQVWTRKEAYIKARGTGLSERLDGFDVTARPAEPARVLRVSTSDEIADEWSLFDVQPLPDVAGAVALRGHDWKVRAWRLDT